MAFRSAPTTAGSARRPTGASALAAALLLGLAACDEAPPPAQAAAPPPPLVSVAKPVVKQLVEWDEYTGRFEAVASVEIRARVDGYLEKTAFTDGAIVKEGDLLFVIDPRPYRAALGEAEARLAAVRTRLALAKVELERYERLARGGNAPERTLDEKRQQFQSAQAEIGGAEAEVERHRLSLSFTQIRAPIGGRVSRKLVTEGNLVKANDTLLTTIVSTDPIYFYFDVDERSYLAYSRMSKEGLRPGARAEPFEVMLALPDEDGFGHKGVLDFVDNRLDAASGTMRARAVVGNRDGLLTPGMFGRIRIPGSPLYSAVLVPDEAIGADLDRRYVYVVGDDNSVRRQVIRVGPRQDGYRIVRRGLTGEETIVVDSLMRVRFGGKITPKPVELPPTR